MIYPTNQPAAGEKNIVFSREKRYFSEPEALKPLKNIFSVNLTENPPNFPISDVELLRKAPPLIQIWDN